MTDDTRDYYGLHPDHTESKTEFASDGEGADHYLLAWTWREAEPGRVLWVNWFVMESLEWHKRTGDDVETGYCLYRRGYVSSPPPPRDELTLEQWREAEFVASGFVKWDGCAQWDCDVHLDSRASRQRFFDMVHLAHQRAAEIMGKAFDGPVAEA